MCSERNSQCGGSPVLSRFSLLIVFHKFLKKVTSLTSLTMMKVITGQNHWSMKKTLDRLKSCNSMLKMVSSVVLSVWISKVVTCTAEGWVFETTWLTSCCVFCSVALLDSNNQSGCSWWWNDNLLKIQNHQNAARLHLGCETAAKRRGVCQSAPRLLHLPLRLLSSNHCLLFPWMSLFHKTCSKVDPLNMWESVCCMLNYHHFESWWIPHFFISTQRRWPLLLLLALLVLPASNATAVLVCFCCCFYITNPAEQGRPLQCKMRELQRNNG